MDQTKSPKMDTLQVPSARYTIQPMDSRLSSPHYDDIEEVGLGYQNTLVSKILKSHQIVDNQVVSLKCIEDVIYMCAN